MIEKKKKLCQGECNEMKFIWKNIDGLKYCRECSSKVEKKPKSSIKPKYSKPSGELALFCEIYAKRGTKCEVTGEYLEFSVGNYAHLISKGSDNSLRLEEFNILQCSFDFHYCFDNMGKEEVLKRYPQAEWVYKKKEDIKMGLYKEKG